MANSWCWSFASGTVAAFTANYSINAMITFGMALA